MSLLRSQEIEKVHPTQHPYCDQQHAITSGRGPCPQYLENPYEKLRSCTLKKKTESNAKNQTE